MLLVIGTINVPPKRMTEARATMARMVMASRAEAGCEAYVYAEDVLELGLVHVKEIWRDQTCLDAHFVADHLVAWRASWSALGIGNRDLSVYEVGEPRRI